jgi:transketolase
MAARDSLSSLLIDTIRTLSMDAVQKANSGHPGTPMALAPLAYVLWDKFLKFNPANPEWLNRDRFVLSAGHASMLLYSILHITGFDITLEDIKSFRQLHSKCPGHPEYGMTPGIEVTTGPLGQGDGTSVGLAIAEKWLARHFNRTGYDIIHHNVYAITSDGSMMEGVSGEAASLAGHLGLSNLIWIYDNNHISIEGNTSLAFTENVGARFLAYNWFVQKVDDANDLKALERSLAKAVNEKERPSLVIVDSHIAFGSPHKQDTAAAHGEPLGEDEVRLTKLNYGWDPDKKFFVPDAIYRYREEVIRRGAAIEKKWRASFDEYAKQYPKLAEELDTMTGGRLPKGWEGSLPEFPAGGKGISTRTASGTVLNSVAERIPWLVGGSADLAPSTKTLIKNAEDFEKKSYGGRNFHFGIREHAMAAIANGLSLSGLRPYAATFLIFSDYMRPSLRFSAIMRRPVIYLFTHDSIGLGEDGTTHQPVEQLAGLRAMPRLEVIRPADANEVNILWKYVLELRDKPAALILTRQDLPVIDRQRYAPASGALRGAYILADAGGTPEIILIGTGSEVHLCIGAYERLTGEGIKARVISMPCTSLFAMQAQEYRDQVLPPAVSARVAVEAGSEAGWERYIGNDGRGSVLGMRDFGVSAPLAAIMQEYGFTVENLVTMAKKSIERSKRSQ